MPTTQKPTGNTYFVFSSDNGYHMGEYRFMLGKMTAYDSNIHVTLIITGPGVPAGLTVQEITENIDLYPTSTELVGAGRNRQYRRPQSGRADARSEGGGLANRGAGRTSGYQGNVGSL